MNKVIIFSAPSGAGKTTVVRHLLKNRDDLAFSVSATTRLPRQGENDGSDYYFLTTEEFQKRIKEDGFVEWEQVYNGLYYGTLKSEVERLWKAGKVVLFDVDVAGGVNLKKIYGDQALSIFVKPPSLKVLETRLRARATESEDKLNERIEKAGMEMRFEKDFDKVLLNDQLEKTLEDAMELCRKFIDG
ncbi:MAG: guanylate kinase [Bacteroidetes bacterium]|nr:guanylate kinase [Bacteroidota bacterium]